MQTGYARDVSCEDFLCTDVMLPVVAEIIHVFEPFVRLEAKVESLTLSGLSAKLMQPW